jgi:hypothetical protein
MLRIRIPQPAATWRHVLVLLLVALTTFAPIARAACDYQHVAELAHNTTTDSRAANQAVDHNPDSSNHGTCCSDSLHVISEYVITSAFDATAGTFTPTLQSTPVAVISLSLQKVGPDLMSRRRPLPPVEPAFRRVPKLLI